MKSSSDRYIKIASLGAVNSGKSTLLGRLLSHWSDRLEAFEEWSQITDSLSFEREKNITWNVSHNFCEVLGYRLHFHDDPGHLSRFDVTLSGVLYSDVVFYVIDPENIDPQLIRFHLSVLQSMNSKRVMLIINCRNGLRLAEAFGHVKRVLSEFWSIFSLAVAVDLYAENLSKSSFAEEEEGRDFYDLLFVKIVESRPGKSRIFSGNVSSLLFWQKPGDKISLVDEKGKIHPPLGKEKLLSNEICRYSEDISLHVAKSQLITGKALVSDPINYKSIGIYLGS